MPPVSKAALAALSAAKSVPEKLRSTCQRDRIGAGTKDDESGLTPAEEDDTASIADAAHVTERVGDAFKDGLKLKK